MTYKGYIGVARVDEDAGVIRGKVVNTRDTITFQGKSFEEAEAAFRDSVDDYLEFCESLGEAPEKPFSGTFLVRVSPDVHRDLSAIAQAQGVSVNKLVSRQLTRLSRRKLSRSIPATGPKPPAPAPASTVKSSKRRAAGK
jgi:predicted HicB family RNase H-like nuclease